MEEKNVSVLPELPAIPYGMTKKQISLKASELVNNLSTGTSYGTDDVLKVAEMLSAMAEFISAVKSDPLFIDMVTQQLMKHGKMYYAPSGAKVEQMEAGTKYDYSIDEVWLNMKAQTDHYADIQKKRESFLKSIPQGYELADPTTGELIAAPPKTSTTTFKITLAK